MDEKPCTKEPKMNNWEYIKYVWNRSDNKEKQIVTVQEQPDYSKLNK